MSMYPRQAGTSPTGLNNDVEIPNPPADSVSCMQFAPQAELLAVGSWDNKVRGNILCAFRVRIDEVVG